MPELAEVERAKNDCKLVTEGKVIAEILTREDNRVFQGCTHDEFARALRGKRIVNVGRLGKYFYLAMQSAPHVVLHLGMAGFVSTRGKEPLFYRKKAKNWKNDDGSDWPLRYWKFALKMQDGSEWCFCDSRRFGRISLIHSGDKAVTEVEPLGILGRDPYLDMPPMDWFSSAVLRRKAPIKAVLLDQNGPLCGLGNWLVDEILFQATIHPAQRASTLTTEQMAALYKNITEVVNTAVAVNADHKLFPKHWLFKYRWGKGRRNEPATFTLPDGSLATVIHQTVGGRTTAIVETVQKLLGEVASDDEAGDDSDQPEDEEEAKPALKSRRGRKKKEDDDETALAQALTTAPSVAVRPGKRRSRTAVKAEEAVNEELPEISVNVGDAAAVKVTTRKRAVPGKGSNKVKVEEVVVETQQISSRAKRASARQSR